MYRYVSVRFQSITTCMRLNFIWVLLLGYHGVLWSTHIQNHCNWTTKVLTELVRDIYFWQGWQERAVQSPRWGSGSSRPAGGSSRPAGRQMTRRRSVSPSQGTAAQENSQKYFSVLFYNLQHNKRKHFQKTHPKWFLSSILQWSTKNNNCDDLYLYHKLRSNGT